MASQILLVMGVTGVGKDTFIKYATGCEVEVGNNLSSCTAKVQYYPIPGTSVFLMDTPGFDDTHISDANIMKEIAESLMAAFSNQAEIQGVLYIHPVTEARMRGSGRHNLIMFKKVLGMKGMSHCRLVTTKWSLQDHELSVAREKELCGKNRILAAASTVRFRDSVQSAIDIIRLLLEGPPFEPLLVEEVVRNRKDLPQTAAGQVVNGDIAEAKKTHAADIAYLKTEQAEAEKRKTLNITAAIVVGGIATVVTSGALGPAAYLFYKATDDAVNN